LIKLIQIFSKGLKIARLVTLDLSKLSDSQYEEFEENLSALEDEVLEKEHGITVLSIMNSSTVFESYNQKSDWNTIDTQNINEEENEFLSLIFPHLEDFTELSKYDIKITYSPNRK